MAGAVGDEEAGCGEEGKEEAADEAVGLNGEHGGQFNQLVKRCIGKEQPNAKENERCEEAAGVAGAVAVFAGQRRGWILGGHGFGGVAALAVAAPAMGELGADVFVTIGTGPGADLAEGHLAIRAGGFGVSV